MRLLIVTQTLDKNDSNLGFFHEWVVGFSKKFERVTVIALNVGAHTLPANVSVHTLGKELGMERIPRMLRYVGLLVRLRKEYTHVFAHMNPEYVIGGGLIWRLLGKKIGLWYVHGAVTLRLRIAEIFAHTIFTASRESCRITSGKIEVVGHGIDTELFKPKEIPHAPSVVSIGRFSPSKQLELIIDACGLVKASIPSVTAKIVGDAGTPSDEGYAKEIKKKAAALGVSVLAPVSHDAVPEFLEKTDVFINASMTGSLDKAVLEAMSAGVVPVTSNIAFKTMLSPLGLFVESKAEAFANVISKLFRNTIERKRLADIVRGEIIAHHSFSRLMDVLSKSFASM